MRPYDKKRQLQRQARIAAYITRCDDALRAELERLGGLWPDRLTVPMWPGRTERFSLVHWIDELTISNGRRLQLNFAAAFPHS